MLWATPGCRRLRPGTVSANADQARIKWMFTTQRARYCELIQTPPKSHNVCAEVLSGCMRSLCPLPSRHSNSFGPFLKLRIAEKEHVMLQ
jgi:hypothetical protein